MFGSFFRPALSRGTGATFGLILAAGAALPASAEVYSFNGITNNDPADVEVGEAQFQVVVSQIVGTPSEVSFTFQNIGPEASSITDIYFSGISGLTYDRMIEGAGVDFGVGATPEHLTGLPPSQFEVAFSTDSEEPVEPNGVNQGESLSLVFDLSGVSFSSLIANLDSGATRIGIRGQGFAGGGSETFMNGPQIPGGGDPGEAVPLPGVVWGGIALFGGTLLKRRRAATKPA